MNLTDSIVDYRRHLKRRNYSTNTADNYLYSIKQFVIWLQIPIETVTHQDISAEDLGGDRVLDERRGRSVVECHPPGERARSVDQGSLRTESRASGRRC